MTRREVSAFVLGIAVGGTGTYLLFRGSPPREVAQPRATSSQETRASEPPTSRTADVEERRRDIERRVAKLRQDEKELERRKAELEQEGQPVASASASARGGGEHKTRRYDLTQQDWAELAAKGRVVYCLPHKSEWSQSELEEFGLGPQDVPILDAAYGRSRLRVLEALRPVCPEDLAKAEEKRDIEMRLAMCASSITEEAIASAKRDGTATFRAMTREVAEIRAGLRPMPPPTASTSSLTSVLLTLTGETDAIVRDLSVQYGAEQARRIVYRQSSCVLGGSM